MLTASAHHTQPEMLDPLSAQTRGRRTFEALRGQKAAASGRAEDEDLMCKERAAKGFKARREALQGKCCSPDRAVLPRGRDQDRCEEPCRGAEAASSCQPVPSPQPRPLNAMQIGNSTAWKTPALQTAIFLRCLSISPRRSIAKTFNSDS